MLAWGPMRSLLAAQHLTYDWLTSVRATVVDVSADVCAHGKPLLQTRLDCFFPKYINGLLVDTALIQQYADAKTFLELRGQNLDLPLCEVCAGFVLESRMGMTVESGHLLSKDQDQWSRWHHLCTRYGMLLPVLPETGLNYYETFEDRAGNQYHYPPKAQSYPLQQHLEDATSHKMQKTKWKHMPPYRYHSMFWIFKFLHELLWKHYSAMDRIQTKHAKNIDQWAQRQARRMQDETTGQPHAVFDTLSPLAQHLVKVDEFIQLMKRRLLWLAKEASNKHIFGFTDLRTEDLNLDALVVEWAHVVGYFLPKTRWLKEAQPVLPSYGR